MNAERDTKSGFTEDERAAMKARAAELKAQKSGSKAKDYQALIDTIENLPDDDRHLAERIHSIVTSVAPHLDPKTWYGFPAYARDGKIVVFFKPASKYTSRYATLGFEEAANLDEGSMWTTSFAITSLSQADEERIAELVKRAAS